MTDCKDEEFLGAIRQYINYWLDQKDRNERQKLEGLAFSILCMLDGVSGSFDGDISILDYTCKNKMLHDDFYKDKND